jgi:uncharacterized membrane protein
MEICGVSVRRQILLTCSCARVDMDKGHYLFKQWIKRHLWLFIAGPMLGGGWASPAWAEFMVCNQTLDVVNVAIGQQSERTFRTEGWWTIGSNQCATTIRENLKYRYVYVYANDVFGQPILHGTAPMCLDPKRFVIEGSSTCWQRGHIETDFLEVDTQQVVRWTLFLTDQGPQ